jgi:histidyl-tRNA synthetase
VGVTPAARGTRHERPCPERAEFLAVRFQAPRGTHDVLPSDRLWWHIVRTMEELAGLYGWGRIQTPGFEDTGLFARTSGAASDVVNKEMYTFADRSDRSLTLRPEGTAPIARAYLEHGLHREPQPVKAYTIAPMYRYGAPGRGRYREHWQLSLEAVGSPGPAIDAEVIDFYVELLRRLGVTQWELRLNSIGDANCRPGYVRRLEAWLDAHEGVLDDDARHKRATSPLQVFDVKGEGVRAALADAPKIGESLCDACRAHFGAVRGYLDALRVPYVLDPVLVRGLDYYSRTTFEFVGPEENVNSTICGGGRYDGLLAAIGGPPTPGIGFGAGVERLALAVERENPPPAPVGLDVFVAVEDEGARPRVLALLAELRRSGISCDTDYAGRSLKGQLTQAKRTGATTVAVVRAADATVRRHGESDRVVPLDELTDTLRA